MSSKSNIIVGLDIGTSSVTVTVGAVGSDGKVTLIGVGRSSSKGLRKGVVINIESTVESIKQAVSQAETMAGVKITSVFASITGSHIKGLNSHGIVGIRNKEVTTYDVEKVIEAAKAVAIPMDREILHVLPQEFIIDEQDGIKEPLGISGVRLEARVHIVTGAVASAQNIVKCANRCGLVVKDIVFSPLAAAKAVLSPEELELGVCVIDIGGGTSDIAVFQGGAVRYTSVVGVGGNHITNDIAAGLRTPIMSAEAIKKQHGIAQVILIGRDEVIEVPSTGERTTRTLSKLALSEIIEPRAQEIFTLVFKDLQKAGVTGFLSGGVVCTGGAANLRGLAQLGERILGIPVRIGVPKAIGGLIELVSGPEYATPVGLTVYGASVKQSVRSHPTGSTTSRVIRKVGNWLAEHF